jgi:FAD/FMN-containing dehydrogenase
MEVGHVRAAEALWQGLMRLNAQALHWSDAAMPLDQPLYLLLKIGGARHDALQTGLEQLVADTRLRYPSTTDIIASSAPQEAALWHLREATDIVYRAHPHAPSFEVSVPLWNIPAYVAQVQAELAALDANLRPYLFGHLADGTLNIILNEPGPLASARARVVEHILYRNLQALGGSFSAEHGVCVKRLGALNETSDDTKDDTKRALLEKIKKLLDAPGVKNRGNIIRG